MEIRNSDLFYLARAGQHHKFSFSQLASLRDDDHLVVCRDGVNYRVSAKNLRGPCYCYQTGTGYVMTRNFALRPYWIDILPERAHLSYNQAQFISNVHNANTTDSVMWVGSGFSTGNVTQALFDLRDQMPVETVTVVCNDMGASYGSYGVRGVYEEKRVMTEQLLMRGGRVTLNTPGIRYLRIEPATPNPRLVLNGIEVNGVPVIGDHYVDSPSAALPVSELQVGGSP